MDIVTTFFVVVASCIAACMTVWLVAPHKAPLEGIAAIAAGVWACIGFTGILVVYLAGAA